MKEVQLKSVKGKIFKIYSYTNECGIQFISLTESFIEDELETT